MMLMWVSEVYWDPEEDRLSTSAVEKEGVKVVNRPRTSYAAEDAPTVPLSAAGSSENW